MIGGRMSKASNSVVLASSLIKFHLGIEPTPDEKKAEVAFSNARSPSRKSPK